MMMMKRIQKGWIWFFDVLLLLLMDLMFMKFMIWGLMDLFQRKLYASFQLSLKFFVCFCTWSEEGKLCYLNLIMTSSEDDRTDHSLLILTWLSKSESLRNFTYSESRSSMSQFFRGLYPSESDPKLQLLSKFKCS